MIAYQQHFTYTALRRQLSMKEEETWKDLPFYTTVELTTLHWIVDASIQSAMEILSLKRRAGSAPPRIADNAPC